MQKSYVVKSPINFADFGFFVRVGDILVHDTANHNRLTVYRNGEIVKAITQTALGMAALVKNQFITESGASASPAPKSSPSKAASAVPMPPTTPNKSAAAVPTPSLKPKKVTVDLTKTDLGSITLTKEDQPVSSDEAPVKKEAAPKAKAVEDAV